MLTAQRLGTAFAPSPAIRGAALSAGAVVAFAEAQGGFFPTSWRVGAVALAAVASLLILWAPSRLTRATTLLIASFVGFALLSVASASWSASTSSSLVDVQRTLLYLTALATCAVAGEGLTAGVAVGAAVVGAFALAGRAFHGAPVDPYEGRLLTGSIGYANGLGALMAIGAAVCVALALSRRSLLCATPLAVLVPALALTESRGSVLAAIAGCAVAAALAAHRRSLAGGIFCLGMAALAAVLIFTPSAAGDRAAYWRAARATIAAHPLGGTGAGTFGLLHQQAPYAHDAHSLYLQTLSELGIPGLLLLCAFLGLPLLLALRRNLTAPAAGLTVFALHAGLDWDWQLPAVTLAALALATAATQARSKERALKPAEQLSGASLGNRLEPHENRVRSAACGQVS